MSHVRVRLHLGGYRLEYSGDVAFFQRVVDPLLEAAAQGAPRGGVERGTRGSRSGMAPAAADATPAEDEDPAPPGDRLEEEDSPGVGRPGGTSSGFRPDSAAFGQFIRQLGPETGQPDRQVVAFAFFLWNYEKKDEVAESEIAGCFEALGLPVPEDLSDLCRQVADGKRFLDAARTPGRWRLTEKGRNYVKTRLFVGG